MTLHEQGFLGPIGPEAHGSRPAYRAGCRCLPCRSANACYEAQRARAMTERPALVDAGAARARLLELAGLKVGIRQAARLAGVSVRTIQRIRTGTATQIRATVARAILGIDRPVQAPGLLINAYTTRHYIESLLREDYEEAYLARRLGIRTVKLGRHVTVRTAQRVYRLWRYLTGEDVDIPDESLARQVRSAFQDAQGGAVFLDSRGVVRPDFHRVKRPATMDE